ncbi:Extracellular GDSL-like lipase/acylhydrolase [Mycena kentingensis (nom. inval.)]|nr:Extracellular GDSL-like lipase/acylhydrolase [Mycena kentingensis (nom. inval.)]
MVYLGFLVALLLVGPLHAIDTQDKQWITAWTTMPSNTDVVNMPPDAFADYTTNTTFLNTTIRQTMHMSLGGSAIRVRLSNAFGTSNLVITAASVAFASSLGSPSIDTGTIRTLTFSGSPRFSIPVGGLALSAMRRTERRYNVPSGESDDELDAVGQRHSGGDYDRLFRKQHGTLVSTTLGAAGRQQMDGRYFVSAIESYAARDAAALFILGDSLSDGYGSTQDANNRRPDLLLARMQQDNSTSHIAVNNQANGGNRILSDVKGPSLLARIDRDVLAQTAIRKYALVFEGVNDLGKADATEDAQSAVGDALILALQQVALRLHAAQIPVFAATITPFGGAAIDSPVRETQRQRVNEFIRTSRVFEAVVDFDVVVADPEEPTRLRAEYNMGDWLHLNTAGYTALAEAFPLGIFEQFAAGVSRYN